MASKKLRQPNRRLRILLTSVNGGLGLLFWAKAVVDVVVQHHPLWFIIPAFTIPLEFAAGGFGMAVLIEVMQGLKSGQPER